MKLGLSSHALTWSVGTEDHRPKNPITPHQLLEYAANLGIHVVQFADNLPLHERDNSEISLLANASAKMGIQIELGIRGLYPDHVRRYIKLAEQMSARILRVVIDTETYKPSEEEVAAILADLQKDLMTAEITLALENHDRFPSKILVRLVEGQKNATVGICLDTANSVGALEAPEATISRLAPYAVNLHLKDIDIFRGYNNMGFVIEGCPLGQGRIDIPWVLGMVGDCTAIIELWPPMQKDLICTIALEQRWLAESVTYARTLITG